MYSENSFKFCPFCGSKINGNERFCTNCGKQINVFVNNKTQNSQKRNINKEKKDFSNLNFANIQNNKKPTTKTLPTKSNIYKDINFKKDNILKQKKSLNTYNDNTTNTYSNKNENNTHLNDKDNHSHKVPNIVRDIIQPKYKNSNPNVRLKAVKKLTDQEILKNIVENDNNQEVQLSAIQKIEDQKFLANIASKNMNSNIRLAAIEKVYEPFLLFNIIEKSENKIIKDKAYNNLKINIDNINYQAIEYIIKHPEYEEFHEMLANKITDISLLCYLINNHKNENITNKASQELLKIIENTNNNDILSKISKKIEDLDIFLVAFEHIKSSKYRQYLIKNISNKDKTIVVARKDEDEQVRRVAIRNIYSEDVLFDIVQKDNNKEVCLEAIEKIKTDELLKDIALTNESKYVCKIALRKIRNNKILKEIVLDDNYQHLHTIAINQIYDKEVLHDIALKHKSYNIRSKCYNKMGESTSSNDENILTDIAINSSMLSQCLKAVRKINKPENLQHISKDAKFKETREESFEKLKKNIDIIDDNTIIEDIIINEKNIEEILKIIKKISDKKILFNILKNMSNNNYKIDILKTINNPEVLTEIALDNSQKIDIRCKAISQINDESILLSLLKKENNNDHIITSIKNKLNELKEIKYAKKREELEKNPVNINDASISILNLIPCLNKYKILKVIDLRKVNIYFKSFDDLKIKLYLTDSDIKEMKKYFYIQNTEKISSKNIKKTNFNNASMYELTELNISDEIIAYIIHNRNQGKLITSFNELKTKYNMTDSIIQKIKKSYFIPAITNNNEKKNHQENINKKEINNKEYTFNVKEDDTETYKIDLNIASLEELRKIPSINLIKAKHIIALREEGIFINSYEDLQEKLSLSENQIIQIKENTVLKEIPKLKTRFVDI